LLKIPKAITLWNGATMGKPNSDYAGLGACRYSYNIYDFVLQHNSMKEAFLYLPFANTRRGFLVYF
jgi:hypothetical protein